jgi:hypothetical protein
MHLCGAGADKSGCGDGGEGGERRRGKQGDGGTWKSELLHFFSLCSLLYLISSGEFYFIFFSGLLFLLIIITILCFIQGEAEGSCHKNIKKVRAEKN